MLFVLRSFLRARGAIIFFCSSMIRSRRFRVSLFESHRRFQNWIVVSASSFARFASLYLALYTRTCFLSATISCCFDESFSDDDEEDEEEEDDEEVSPSLSLFVRTSSTSSVGPPNESLAPLATGRGVWSSGLGEPGGSAVRLLSFGVCRAGGDFRVHVRRPLSRHRRSVPL